MQGSIPGGYRTAGSKHAIDWSAVRAAGSAAIHKPGAPTFASMPAVADHRSCAWPSGRDASASCASSRGWHRADLADTQTDSHAEWHTGTTTPDTPQCAAATGER